LWRDRNAPERTFVNLAVVQAPAHQAQPPFVSAPAPGGWLAVASWGTQKDCTATGLDAVAAEAARLAGRAAGAPA
jgi:hypothetical protein